MSILDKASLIQIPSGYKSTKLYSLRPINGDGDFTFARSSSATRVNSEGLIEVASVLGSEEVVNGDFATDTDWNKSSFWTISGGTASMPTTSSYQPLYQNNVTVGGKKYVLNFDIISISGIIKATSIDNGATTGEVILAEYSTNGSKKIIFTAQSGREAISFARVVGSTSSCTIDNVSVKEVIENDVPRLDYSGGASCASLLLEPQRTNLIRFSESFENSWWQKLNNVIVSGTKVTSPDGTLNASQLIFDGTTDGRIEKAITGLTSGADYSVSIYARVSSGTQVVSFGSVNVESFTLTTEWQRLKRTEAENDTVGYPRFICSDVATIEVWGFQLEQGSYPTSYIPSNSNSQTTRTADVCNNAGTSATFNSTEGVLFAEIAALAENGGNRGIAISDGTSSNRVLIYYTTTTNQITALYTYNGTTQVSINKTFTDSTQFSKCAFKYKENDCAFWIDGVEVGADNTATAFAADTLDTLNFDSGAGGSDFYGKTKQLMVFNEALSDEELADLTGAVHQTFNSLATFYGYTIL